MEERLDRKKALKMVLDKARECLSALEKTAFIFHSYKDEIFLCDVGIKESVFLTKEEKISYIYIGHLKAMSRKIVEAFDQKSDPVQDFIIVYEAIKALLVSAERSMKTSNGNGNGKQSCLVSA